jgi:AcrR family transcriptional regulator
LQNTTTVTSSRSEKTKDRLLKTTESIFANRGFGGLTLREVAQRSHTNLASANYHFGSKEAMVLEMLQARVRPINQRRMKYLAEARERAQGKPLSTRDILRALILPIGEEIAKSTHTRQTLAQLVARTFTEPAKFIQTMHRKFFGELCEKFMDELRKTHPKVEERDLYWNLHLAVSSMLGALAQHRRLKDFSKGACDEDDTQDMIERLITFSTHGFEAGISQSSV